MYKHGWKTNVNYAPLRESLAASILYDTGIIQKAKKQRSLKLWDPFCGSGTFILEALSLYLNLSVR
jgi:putative N6-adenine-specific DNA methylase